MWAKDRKHRIISLLAVNEHLSIERMVDALKVSRESIRRDIIELEADGKLQRVHGGVTRVPAEAEPPFKARLHANAEAKRRISVTAARLLEPGMICAIDAGSTTTAFAAALMTVPGISVVTNSIDVAATIRAGQSDADVILLGGVIGRDVPGTYGELTLSEMRRFTCDITFFSPVSLSAEKGATNYHLTEAELARAMIESSQKVVVLADSSKLGTTSRVQVCGCEQIDLLVTDPQATDAQLDALRGAGLAEVLMG
ncbi:MULTISPECIES: DeoR/GlpR family DNA-binding transcription regulator [unclassified Burkholderia]|uniref:DeoR/GlpR family DNA-binding transcription regulator n=1 Tax=unclassified Burkholderia TaxID=2613784 RepID=UPI002AB006A7|nr:MULTISPECIES: DeoR/GlpR family DNA-binding transcription regulator [unclassified Burkholderia]